MIRKAATQYAEILNFPSVCLETAPEAEESPWQGFTLTLCTGNAEVPEIVYVILAKWKKRMSNERMTIYGI